MRRRASDAAGAVTIADVAARAGVSTATVSRALANPDRVRPGLVARVMDAVRESGYTPNSSARMLRTRRTNMILVIVPSIASQIYAHVLRGIDTGLAPAGYGVIIGNLDSSPGNQARFVDLAFSRQVDGVMVLSGSVPGSAGRSLAAAGLPMVSVLTPVDDLAVPHVAIDDRAAGREAALYFARLGHRRLAYSAGVKGHRVDTARWAGFQEGAQESGLPPCDVVRLEGEPDHRYSYLSGVAAARRFLGLRDRPTAVFCSSDQMAIGFLKVVREAGLRVPQDVALLGIDGIDATEFTDPVLSTIRQPRQDLGRAGAELLLSMLQGTFDPTRSRIALPFELLARDSTEPRARGADPAGARERIGVA